MTDSFTFSETRIVARQPKKPRVTLLGTGNAFNTDGRLSQALFVEPHRGSPFLVDVGPTALAGMANCHVSPEPIDRVFITHLHGDHIAGWPFLVIDFLYVQKRQRPLHVYGPSGTRETLTKLIDICYGELFTPDRASFTVHYHELDVEERRTIEVDHDVGDGLTVDTLPMDHHPTSIGYCFHFSSKHRLGVSGDTCWCSGLQKLAASSTVLVTECTMVEKEAPGHLSVAELVARRVELDAPSVVVVHLCDAVAAALSRARLEGVIVGEDGMTVAL